MPSQDARDVATNRRKFHDLITVVNHLGTGLLATAMEKARRENPRGDLYRTMTLRKLFTMLEQNIDELFIALKYGNDVEDKIADCANFLAFILDNYLNEPSLDEILALIETEGAQGRTVPRELLESISERQKRDSREINETGRELTMESEYLHTDASPERPKPKESWASPDGRWFAGSGPVPDRYDHDI